MRREVSLGCAAFRPKKDEFFKRIRGAVQRSSVVVQWRGAVERCSGAVCSVAVVQWCSGVVVQ